MSYLLFGGAFNPPTKAHIELAEYACEKTGAMKVIFMPSKMSYIEHDQAKNFAFHDTERLAMLESICKAHPNLMVSDYELKEESQPRTYQTLCYLKEQGYACKLLFGSDKLPELKTGWKYVEEIAKEFGIVCMARYDDNCEKMIADDSYLSSLSQYIEIVHTPKEYHHISSSEVRKQFLIAKDAIQILQDTLPKELHGLSSYLFSEDNHEK